MVVLTRKGSLAIRTMSQSSLLPYSSLNLAQHCLSIFLKSLKALSFLLVEFQMDLSADILLFTNLWLTLFFALCRSRFHAAVFA